MKLDLGVRRREARAATHSEEISVADRRGESFEGRPGTGAMEALQQRVDGSARVRRSAVVQGVADRRDTAVGGLAERIAGSGPLQRMALTLGDIEGEKREGRRFLADENQHVAEAHGEKKFRNIKDAQGQGPDVALSWRKKPTTLRKLGNSEPLRIVAHGSFTGKIGGYAPGALAGLLVDVGLGEKYKGSVWFHGCLAAHRSEPGAEGTSFIERFREEMIARKRVIEDAYGLKGLAKAGQEQTVENYREAEARSKKREKLQPLLAEAKALMTRHNVWFFEKESLEGLAQERSKLEAALPDDADRAPLDETHRAYEAWLARKIELGDTKDPTTKQARVWYRASDYTPLP
jgi:hypothetical protein